MRKVLCILVLLITPCFIYTQDKFRVTADYGNFQVTEEGNEEFTLYKVNFFTEGLDCKYLYVWVYDARKYSIDYVEGRAQELQAMYNKSIADVYDYLDNTVWVYKEVAERNGVTIKIFGKAYY
jgi:hypothetical protein